jgi:tRNA1Val (adenine37-N6)-methyltransferase
MKVCTDACLFGAWVADHILQQKIKPAPILDIGAGTGLLSLMLAQSTTAAIDAIELDEQAAEQARDNFEASPWHERLQILQGDARLIHLGKKYSFIISNPPFFGNDQKQLSTDGKFAVLLPWHRKNEFIQLAGKENFFPAEVMDVKQTATHACFRTMLLFSRNESLVKNDELIIREDTIYSVAFSYLLKDYYLNP